ncbi:helix-turn-helix transcriptional regulator [Vibrio cionasavignyae]|uniref:helix-turn-helix transcriptional regulator n=1 Tax=Vibrio cionasavignyae TaxID=2910252 RepID=UPI003D11198A
MTRVTHGIPLIRADSLHDLGELYKEQNPDIHALIASISAPLDVQQCHQDFLPEATLRRLIRVFGESCSPQAFIIAIQHACKTRYIPSVIAQLSQYGPKTVRSALEQFNEIISDHSSGARLSLTHFNGDDWFVRDKEGVCEDWFKYAEVFSVIFMNELVSALSGRRHWNTYVTLRTSDMESFITCPQLAHIQFFTHRSVTGIRLDASILNTDALLHRYPSNHAAQVLRPIPIQFVPAFKQSLQPYVRMGKLPLSQASRILCLHTRTIQRRLHAVGLTYRDVIEEIVLERAQDLLLNSCLSITAIAANMGYGDSANFTRFFKRKMAMTPSQYRCQKSAKAGVSRDRR